MVRQPGELAVVAAAETVIRGGMEQLAVSAPAALGIAALVLVAGVVLVGGTVVAIGAAVTFLAWRYDRQHPPGGVIDDALPAVFKRGPVIADNVREAIERITREERRG